MLELATTYEKRSFSAARKFKLCNFILQFLLGTVCLTISLTTQWEPRKWISIGLSIVAIVLSILQPILSWGPLSEKYSQIYTQVKGIRQRLDRLTEPLPLEDLSSSLTQAIIDYDSARLSRDLLFWFQD